MVGSNVGATVISSKHYPESKVWPVLSKSLPSLSHWTVVRHYEYVNHHDDWRSIPLYVLVGDRFLSAS